MQFSDWVNSLSVALLHLAFACAASQLFFDCVKYPYCAYEDFSAKPMKYSFGPASQVVRGGLSTCSVSTLPSKSIINVCCDNPVGLLKPRPPGSAFTVSDNDYKNRFKCHKPSKN
ncbi:hypothetical protein MJO29_006736 [Puccinia striiformis f. sp. tritici]|nr:hypothetical protein Pst134EA_011937 [Puccinia striiformis f. sp. tritici]KAH9468313.1 hypothetical protein Pst134EA_011937 [Puccinia striiformis f. sp. tritici]KAI7958519.1 hypothetical protein MJO29_006736 [Puccinia striiformis f. sp. tritici]